MFRKSSGAFFTAADGLVAAAPVPAISAAAFARRPEMRAVLEQVQETVAGIQQRLSDEVAHFDMVFRHGVVGVSTPEQPSSGGHQIEDSIEDNPLSAFVEQVPQEPSGDDHDTNGANPNVNIQGVADATTKDTPLTPPRQLGPATPTSTLFSYYMQDYHFHTMLDDYTLTPTSPIFSIPCNTCHNFAVKKSEGGPPEPADRFINRDKFKRGDAWNKRQTGDRPSPLRQVELAPCEKYETCKKCEEIEARCRKKKVVAATLDFWRRKGMKSKRAETKRTESPEEYVPSLLGPSRQRRVEPVTNINLSNLSIKAQLVEAMNDSFSDSSSDSSSSSDEDAINDNIPDLPLQYQRRRASFSGFDRAKLVEECNTNVTRPRRRVTLLDVAAKEERETEETTATVLARYRILCQYPKRLTEAVLKMWEWEEMQDEDEDDDGNGFQDVKMRRVSF